MGPNVKFVSPICDLISERKNRGNFQIYKKTIPGGGGPRGGLAKDRKKYVFFWNPSLTSKGVNMFYNTLAFVIFKIAVKLPRS